MLAGNSLFVNHSPSLREYSAFWDMAFLELKASLTMREISTESRGRLGNGLHMLAVTKLTPS